MADISAQVDRAKRMARVTATRQRFVDAFQQTVDEALLALHGMGVRLSIDGFGTGYSSLAYLKKLPVCELKIDRGFVAQLDRDTDDATIVRSTIELAHGMGLRVVAEGVESDAMLQRLGTFGCDEAQGYLIGRPLPAQALAQWLLQHRETGKEEPATLD